jgi:DNA topoisomerase-3
VGINGTRAMTAFNSRDGGFFLTTVGRVQTPTLAVVVEREEQIRKFISRDYWEIHASFCRQAGSTSANGSTRALEERCQKMPRKRPTASGALDVAQAIADAVRGKASVVDRREQAHHPGFALAV